MFQSSGSVMQPQQQQQNVSQMVTGQPMSSFVSFQAPPMQHPSSVLIPAAGGAAPPYQGARDLVSTPSYSATDVGVSPAPSLYTASSHNSSNVFVIYAPADQQQMPVHQQTSFIPLNPQPTAFGYPPAMSMSKAAFPTHMAAPPGGVHVLTAAAPTAVNWAMPVLSQNPFIGHPFTSQSPANSTNTHSGMSVDRECRGPRSRDSGHQAHRKNSTGNQPSSGTAAQLAEGKSYSQDPVPIDTTKRQLIVNFLPQRLSNEDFRQLFRPYGPLIENASHIIYDLRHVKSGSRGGISPSDTAIVTRSKGYGFIYYKDGASTEAAIKELNGKEVLGRRIKVRYADQQRFIDEEEAHPESDAQSCTSSYDTR